ncbi:hypothetical protein MLD38_038582 [Melastoma candidum]|uniref:Uncharacterized protein n=1 Tax=Melastoma candidum TaxID=119954 RepID=A0ACB9KZC2_9MYRT|nr:hypothetical protein MLD38_038582 [Melastoma candidum]
MAAESSRRRCGCLSHLFDVSSSRNPGSIAVVHASGGVLLSAEFRRRLRSGGDCDSVEFFDGRARSSCPPLYDGDVAFTYSDLSSAVARLAPRIRCVLDGGDDPGLTKSSADQNEVLQAHLPKFSFVPSSRDGTVAGDSYVPKVIGILVPPSAEYIVSVLSILRCGEAFLAIDPSWPKERILSVVHSSGVELIISYNSQFVRSESDIFDWLLNSVICPVLVFSMDDSKTTNGISESPEPAMLYPCQRSKSRLFCYVMYTSGSTGKPKGVCGTERGLVNRYTWMQEFYPLVGPEILLFKTSVCFVDHLQEFLGAILSSCTLIVPPSHELKRNPLSVVDFMEAYHISRLTAVPSLMRVIMSTLQNQSYRRIPNSLQLIVLSGESFSLSLWKMLSSTLPNTSFLNLYGSTEVSGDCTYFDCKRLGVLLETDSITSVPIGLPIANCDVVLVNEDEGDHGEIFVGGICISAGCISEISSVSSDFVELSKTSHIISSYHEQNGKLFNRTGDFARQLRSGDLVYLGRKDRIVKINGHRIALEEVENALRSHRNVVDAAVIVQKVSDSIAPPKAFVIVKDRRSNDLVRSIRDWLLEKLPIAMIPIHIFCVDSFPLTCTGKVDYESLSASLPELSSYAGDNLLQAIKKAFCDVLLVEEVSEEDDFFGFGGNSVAAAHAAHSLGINMKLLYDFPTPLKLWTALSEKSESANRCLDQGSSSVTKVENFYSSRYSWPELEKNHLVIDIDDNIGRESSSKRLKVTSQLYLKGGYSWISVPLQLSCSFTRCNRIMYRDKCGFSEIIFERASTTSMMHRVWKVPMQSCVDASPLVVIWNSEIYVFIGSHSHMFLCIDAKSGFVQWETKLDGRIECSAAITGDFSQVVVGCYDGNIYFLDIATGKICWSFQTGGEVKTQPIVDSERQLTWCGSHDHNLYALDYRSHQCVYNISCGGSIFGSPAIDEEHCILYVGSTVGRITAISIRALPFSLLWLHELEVPIFGSLAVSSSGMVICCLVDGSVVGLDRFGSILWRRSTGGPVFAGASFASSVPSQVLICSRSGSILSLEPETGQIWWECNVGIPVIASAYVDEHLLLPSEKLVCICTCSGSIVVLGVGEDSMSRDNGQNKCTVREVARMDLEGEVFSSPVMVGGVIFVGCRDDFVHCVALGTNLADVSN